MSTIARLDPELAAVMELIPPEGLFDLRDIPAARAQVQELMTAMAAQLPPLPADVQVTDHEAPGPDGAPAVRVRVYTPREHQAPLPALLWIHGGGYVLGTVEADDHRLAELARAIPCVVASVDYRLAPEHPFPAPLEDCYAGLRWLHREGMALGVDPARIAIGGASAGGGLAAALALLARDRAEVPVVYQLLIYPMLDDRNQTPSSYEITDPRLVWTREMNLIGWRSYLGREPGSADVPAYAVPARAENPAGLPPAYVVVGELDLFRDEDITYAQRLLQAGVPTELHVFPGAFHGWDIFAPEATLTKRFLADRDAVLRRALHGATAGTGATS